MLISTLKLYFSRTKFKRVWHIMDLPVHNALHICTWPPWFKKHKRLYFQWKLRKAQFWNLDSSQLLQSNNRKHSDWLLHKLAWFIMAQDGKALLRVIKTTRTSLVPSTEHQWHQWSETSAQSPKETKRQHPPRHSLFTLLPSGRSYRNG